VGVLFSERVDVMTTSESTYPLPRPAIIGVVHLPPLPGTWGATQPIEQIAQYAVSEARVLDDAGFDAVIMENFGDAPFHAEHVEPHTVAAMTVVAQAVRRDVELPLGINVLRNDVMAALAIAAATDAAFVRVNVLTGVYATDQGVIEGRAAEVMRFREGIACGAAVLADVHVKHAVPMSQPDIVLAAEETAYRGRADALILTGPTTGRPTDFADVDRVRAAVPDRPILIGSGVTPDTVAESLRHADGVIVGTAIKQDGNTTNPIERSLAEQLIERARS
jgi:membrane complex biogenesis BtpA family protein